ncbi:MAG TPA: histidine kinase dimerization/phospho-acceptor domain-containing protein [Gemmatimonadaceae bacterium]
MPHQTVAPTPEIESSLLGVLLSADSTREGATALLGALSPAIGDVSAALAVRDRDGLTLHVLAEVGAPRRWPARLEPQFAVGVSPGVDPGTATMVVPLRASGRVVGALIFGDPAEASELLRDRQLDSLLETTAAVLHALVSRTDAELRRRAGGRRSLDEILEGIAHQIANPLTGASAIAQLLAEDLQDEGQRAAVLQIRHELTRAFTVLHDLLEFQRDTGAQDGILDLNAIVDRIIRFRGYAIRELGIALEVETTPGFMPVRADARGIEHAMLIALRFAELQSHGTVNRSIRVRVRERGASEVAVEIIDSGPGDIPELTATYFDLPFNSEHSARPSSDKPDLGLADSILRGYGGSLQATGAKEDGATLTLVLPRARTSNSNSTHLTTPQTQSRTRV